MDVEPQMNTDRSQIKGLPSALPHYPHQGVTHGIIGGAMEVHRRLGPGFLECVYENALAYELRTRGLKVAAQEDIDVKYKNVVVGTYCCDLLVDGVVLCEIKATAGIDPAHEAQLINYLKATGIKVGLLLNFGTNKLEVKRMVF